ncbi:DNA-3-methyladenine glycosylase 2 [Massilia sp. LXY-6]|uniref:DNA-3-methyladenine glycosylase 2 n=1 Tax=Massilia sp. LXY-6 TaxID=3379823 RepID=UPI003EE1A93F
MSRFALSIDLPPDYRRQDVFTFHGRDAEGLAERIEGDRIRKGVMVDGLPTVLEVELGAQPGQALCTVNVDGGQPPAAAHGMLLNILGLRIDPAPFEAAVADDALFAPLVARARGLRVIQSATIFEALSWAIIGQQINLGFAIALRRTFIALAGRAHPDGLWCYPEAVDAARLDLDQLTSRKFSRAKAETLLRLARLAADGELDLRRDADPHQVSERLLAVKGIGPWTVNYALLRGYGFPDCSLEGDVAVRTAIGRLLGAAERPTLPEAAAFLQAYRPHRTMASAHLWVSLSQTAG